MNSTGNWPLIAKHLTQSSTPEEERDLAAWAGSSAENKQILDEAIRIWKLTSNRATIPAIETEKEWMALLQRMETDARNPEKPVSRSLPTLLKVAAAIIGLMAFYFFFFRKTIQEEVAPQVAAIIPRDTLRSDSLVRQIFLADSSSVWLNLSSRLIFDKAFGRKVLLMGEAFFEIRKDSVPFEVETANTRIRVLGTTFNVKAREHQTEEVSVMKGKVEFGGSDSTETKIVLKPNERAAYDSTSHKTQKQPFDKNTLDWMKKNNPVYDAETRKPSQYVKNSYTWKKNLINQTQIDGTITNNARLAAYGKIKLKIQYTTAKGKKSQVFLDLLTHEQLHPGQSIPYRQTLFDVFSKKTEVFISIEKIEFIP